MNTNPKLTEALCLYAILDPDLTQGRDPLWVAERALRGGSTCIQLRAKHLTDRARFAMAVNLRALTRAHSAALIINDRLDIALACDADGVHIGPDDLPLATARALMGDARWVGVSAPSVEAACAAQAGGADYLGVGALYEARAVKPEASAPRGPAWLKKVRAAVHLPLVGIGGVDLPQIPEVIAAGACGVAVIRAICAAPDPERTAHDLKDALETALHARALPLK